MCLDRQVYEVIEREREREREKGKKKREKESVMICLNNVQETKVTELNEQRV